MAITELLLIKEDIALENYNSAFEELLRPRYAEVTNKSETQNFAYGATNADVLGWGDNISGLVYEIIDGYKAQVANPDDFNPNENLEALLSKVKGINLINPNVDEVHVLKNLYRELYEYFNNH